MNKTRHIVITALLAIIAITAQAQCKFRNTAFSSGEFLTYNLYYNWQFIWVKAGNASLSTIQTVYKGKPAYRASLTTRRYTVDEVFYSYQNNKCNIRQHRQKNDGTHVWNTKSLTYCVYDMLNIFLRARSFSVAGWKKGHIVDFPIADGDGVTPARLLYKGKKTIKGDNNVKYRCLQLSYLEKEDGKYKRIVDFYVTDDANHVPVRLDMFLRFGAAKAFLVGYKGLRNPTSSIVK